MPRRGELEPSDVVGERYRVLEEVGAGAFGVVYRAQHVVTRQVVALKVLHHHMAVDEATRARFQREVSAPAAIDHPGIAQVYDAAIDDRGRPYVAMEWLDGETLAAYLPRAPVSVEGLISLFLALLEPLEAAHRAGFVHRDLKPETVFERDAGALEVRVLDFGLAKRSESPSVTETGTAIGTPRYMSPEQFMDSKSAGPPADVWAVGTMLYEALAGEPPFRATSHALVLAVLTAPHVPIVERVPDLPPALIEVVEACLRKEPAERPPDATALSAGLREARAQLDARALATTIREMPRVEIPPALEPATSTVPTTVMPVSRPIPAGGVPVTRERKRRRPVWPWAAAVLLALAIASAATAAAVLLRDAHEPAPSSPPSPAPAPSPAPPPPPMQPSPEPATEPDAGAAPEAERPGAESPGAEPRRRAPRSARRAPAPATEDRAESAPEDEEHPRLPNPFELLEPLTEP